MTKVQGSSTPDRDHVPFEPGSEELSSRQGVANRRQGDKPIEKVRLGGYCPRGAETQRKTGSLGPYRPRGSSTIS